MEPRGGAASDDQIGFEGKSRTAPESESGRKVRRPLAGRFLRAHAEAHHLWTADERRGGPSMSPGATTSPASCLMMMSAGSPVATDHRTPPDFAIASYHLDGTAPGMISAQGDQHEIRLTRRAPASRRLAAIRGTGHCAGGAVQSVGHEGHGVLGHHRPTRISPHARATAPPHPESAQLSARGRVVPHRGPHIPGYRRASASRRLFVGSDGSASYPPHSTSHTSATAEIAY